MPVRFHPAVTKRVQEMWEDLGLRGDSHIARMQKELSDRALDWTKNLPDGDNTRLPGDRSTLNRMAKRLDWRTVEESDDEDSDGPISGVADPIWHLSKILGRRKAHEYTHWSAVDGIPNPFRAERIDVVVTQIEFDVAVAYEPHTKMFRKLRPLLRKWVGQEKKEFQEREKEALGAQAQVAAMAEAGLLPQLRRQGLPIDEGHA